MRFFIRKKEMRLGFIPLLNEYYTKNKIFAANGLAYVASYLEKKLGYTDFFLEMDPQKMIAEKPDIIGISTITENYGKAIEFSQVVKEKLRVPVMIGGVHITSLPHTLPESIDVGIISEGEETSAELMQVFFKHKSFPLEELQKIPGICYRNEEGKVVINKNRPLTKNLDDLPPPNRHLVKNKDGFWTQSILTSRGCPFDCIYCSAIKLWDGVRFHSPERVVSDIEDIMRNFPDQFMIVIDDDLFAMHPKRLEEIVRLIKQEKIDKKVCFSCQGRSSNFSEKIARLLKEMNMKLVTFGFESVIDRVLSEMKGPSANNEKNMKAVELCNKYDMDAVACFITDTYMETKEEAARTYWILKEQEDKVHPHFFHMTPLPATPTWHYAKQRGLVDDYMEDWSVFNINYNPDKSIYMNENYTKEEFDNEIYPTLQTLTHPEFYLDIEANVQTNKELYTKRLREEEYRNLLSRRIPKLVPSFVKDILEITNNRENLAKIKDGVIIQTAKIKNGWPDFELIPADNSIELLYLDHSLELFREPLTVLQEINRYLKKKHYLLINVYNSTNNEILSKMLKSEIRYNKRKEFPDNAFHFFTIDSLKKFLTVSRYDILSITNNSIPSNLGFRKKNSEDLALEKYLPFLKKEQGKNDGSILSYTILAQS